MNDHEILPFDSSALAAWFAEGVLAELAVLEKDGGTQVYEVQSGKLIETKGPNQGIFLFVIADGTRIPEDATGKLKTEENEFTASVIWQQGNLIHIHLEGKSLPPNIHWARLIIDDTALIRRLAQILEELAKNSTDLTPLATEVFHPSKATISFANLPDTPALVGISSELRRILEQACGSSVTYVWGPPGTGKTHAIAHLITALIESGERILITSHTKAAVDQALYEAVKNEEGKRGPLEAHIAVSSGRVLRIGFTVDRRIPNSVLVDKVLESKGQDLQKNILEIEAKIYPLSKIMEYGRTTIFEWDKLAEFAYRLNKVQESIEKANLRKSSIEESINMYKYIIRQRCDVLEKAQRAWFRKDKKTSRAKLALQKAEFQLRKTEEDLTSAIQDKEKAQQSVNNLENALERQRKTCANLPGREVVAKELSEVTLKLNSLEGKLRAMQEELSRLGQSLIDSACAIFCTLTKNYIGKELEGQKFDAVIVDEISMALPPLIFLAAGRAKSRVILVGDFLQLPPIVRSDTPISNARLGTDTFRLAKVVNNQNISSPALVKLTTQHRMVPAIANVARHLVYNGCARYLFMS